MPSSSVVVRAIDQADYEGWRRCFRGYCEFYKSPYDDALAQHVFHDMILPPTACMKCLVATVATTFGDEDGGKRADEVVVGIAHYRSAPSSLDGRNTCFLDDLFTVEEARSRGVGRALIKAVQRLAHQRGEPILQWITAETNVTARKLYDQVAKVQRWKPYGIAIPTPAQAAGATAKLADCDEEHSAFSISVDLSEADAESWTRLFRAYADFYSCALPPNSAVPTTVFRDWLLTPSHPQKAIVARDTRTGTVIGFAHYRPRPRPMNGGDVGYLDDLFVDDAYRGTGVGQALLLRFYDICHAHQWPRAHWLTAGDNSGARRLYERCGASPQPSLIYEMPTTTESEGEDELNARASPVC